MNFRLTFALLFSFSVVPAAFAADFGAGLLKEHSYETEHFSIEFSDLLMGQSDADNNGIADVVEEIADYAEESYALEVGHLDYADPMEGTDRRLILVLDDTDDYLSQDALGVTSLLSNGDPFMAVDPWMSSEYLQVTIAHEFFHCIQFAYDPDFAYTDQGSNWAEASAVWMEDQVFDTVDDYVNYIADFFDYADYSIFASVVPTGTLFQYGLNIWPRFLSEYYKTPDVIMEIWLAYVHGDRAYDDDRRLYEAVKEVVSARGDNLDKVFQKFSLWNLNLASYEEGNRYPDVLVLDEEETEEHQLIDSSFAPALFGTNYLYFDNTDEEESFYFHVVKPDGIRFSVSLVPYDLGKAQLSKVKSTLLDEDEEMAELLELDGLSSSEGVYVVISPLEKDFGGSDHTADFDEGYLYYYFGQYGAKNADFGTFSIDSSLSTDQKEGQDSSTTPDVRLPEDLSLNVVNYDDDSVTFSWNRLVDTDIASYALSYGTKSEHYSVTQSIDKPYTTSIRVSGLDEGKTYYFVLNALDEDGNEVGDSSLELQVTPEAWVFNDVSPLDTHEAAISALVAQGIFKGYSDGSFKPSAAINRAEFLKILIEGQGVTPSANYHNCFTDVSAEWYASYVCYAEEEGWIEGYSDGSFRPADPVNKVEALKMLFAVYGVDVEKVFNKNKLVYGDLNRTEWYAPYVVKASDLGLLEEAPGEDFAPDEDRTRGEMAEILYRYLVVEELIKE